jgi:hypothetical protein
MEQEPVYNNPRAEDVIDKFVSKTTDEQFALVFKVGGNMHIEFLAGIKRALVDFGNLPKERFVRRLAPDNTSVYYLSFPLGQYYWVPTKFLTRPYTDRPRFADGAILDEDEWTETYNELSDENKEIFDASWRNTEIKSQIIK